MVRWSWREAVVPAYHLMVFDGAAARIVHLPRIGVREGFNLFGLEMSQEETRKKRCIRDTPPVVVEVV